MTDRFPRPLQSDESAMLDRLLAAEFAGVIPLRSQIASTEVIGTCPCGCPTIDLSVDGATVNSPSVVVCEAVVHGQGTVDDQILLLVRDGRLDRVEYVFYGDVPKAWPDPDLIQVTGQARI